MLGHEISHALLEREREQGQQQTPSEMIAEEGDRYACFGRQWLSESSPGPLPLTRHLENGGM